MNRIIHTRWFAPLVFGFVVTLGTMMLYVTQPSFIIRMDLRVYDALLSLRAAPAPSDIPVIIDIDEASLAAYG